jgi:hypothetical protein
MAADGFGGDKGTRHFERINHKKMRVTIGARCKSKKTAQKVGAN